MREAGGGAEPPYGRGTLRSMGSLEKRYGEQYVHEGTKKFLRLHLTALQDHVLGDT